MFLFFLAYPCPPWYWPRCLPRRQALPPARWCRGCLHLFRRFHQDSREHPQGYLRGRLQHLRLLDPLPLEGDQVDQESPGRVRGYPARWQAILDGSGNGARSHDPLVFHCMVGRLGHTDLRL